MDESLFIGLYWDQDRTPNNSSVGEETSIDDRFYLIKFPASVLFFVFALRYSSLRGNDWLCS